jgi:hypothetical protein
MDPPQRALGKMPASFGKTSISSAAILKVALMRAT